MLWNFLIDKNNLVIQFFYILCSNIVSLITPESSSFLWGAKYSAYQAKNNENNTIIAGYFSKYKISLK